MKIDDYQTLPDVQPYFVYVLMRPDGVPFYVGMSGSLYRLQHHIKTALKGEQSPKAATIRSIINAGDEITWKIVSWHFTQKECGMAERALITRIGLNNLTNLTGGRLTLETRQKISDGLRRAYQDQALRRKQSEWQRGKPKKPLTPEHRRAISNTLRERHKRQRLEHERIVE